MERLSDAVRGELSRFGVQAGLAELVERWPGAVGQAIARNAWPARIGRDGTLHVNTADSVWAFELAQQARRIAERLEVAAVRFAPGPLPGADEAPPATPTLEPTLAEAAEAAGIAAAAADPELRKSIQRALALTLARARADRRV